MVVSSIEPSGSLNRRPEFALREEVRLNHPRLAVLEHRIAQTVGYMRACLNQPLQVTRLARMANVSPSHFFAVFKKQTGFAPIDFFIRLRMERACELLAATEMSIKEIAAALGYDDPFYFSRLFKSVHQVAPSIYRVRGMTPSASAMNSVPLSGVQLEANMSTSPRASQPKAFCAQATTDRGRMTVSAIA